MILIDLNDDCLLGDTPPLYHAGSTTIELKGSPSSQITATVKTVCLSDEIESSEWERKFDNPIYGDCQTDEGVYTVPLSYPDEQSQSNYQFMEERKFDNPIYGDYETDNGVYAAPFNNKQDQSSHQQTPPDHELSNPIYGTVI